ncbi:hypothetical protein [Pontibacter sp. G13]|uniref:hypothetical protein n=1 Tax=Pontibacter sp. G13 TaxID=3074898 RepID=UPI00288AC5F9|nr:hypothetical protein [Pontibacter sp. G13]WNJ16787.1 hypothetical protein RJD25_18115 [Pontibacter sp. G13]
MTVKYLAPLNETEQELTLKVPALVVLLVSAADSEIHKKEEAAGKKLIHYRAFTADVVLHDYYEAVNVRFDGDVEPMIANWKGEESLDAIKAELAKMPEILAKLDTVFVDHLKTSWRTLAHEVAKAEGGIMGFGAITPEELKVVDLPMID